MPMAWKERLLGRDFIGVSSHPAEFAAVCNALL